MFYSISSLILPAPMKEQTPTCQEINKRETDDVYFNMGGVGFTNKSVRVGQKED